jgi:cytochrome c-type biogenesis protein CcmH/NrfG
VIGADVFDLLPASDAKDWRARFYLAMALGQAGRLHDARKEFMSIKDLCPDPEFRRRAESAIHALNSSILKNQASPKD